MFAVVSRHKKKLLLLSAVLIIAFFVIPRPLACYEGGADEFVALEGGEFVMGGEALLPEEGPAKSERVQPFAIQRHEVTNAQYAEFVRESGYVTRAEKGYDPEQFAGIDAFYLQPGSFVFQAPRGGEQVRPESWWVFVPKASWRHPAGEGSDIRGLENHPVVHIAFEDAEAYAKWAGGRLPNEAEWEYAALGGERDASFSWMEAIVNVKNPPANVWQGRFPYFNANIDGAERSAPAGCYAPNGYGLYDMVGNVWEWTLAKADHDALTRSTPPQYHSHLR
ncbi:MAG: SUMF1/EgtB/PvdO family nonheme iron enzyme, partial [Parvibaculales bacterium]